MGKIGSGGPGQRKGTAKNRKFLRKYKKQVNRQYRTGRTVLPYRKSRFK